MEILFELSENGGVSGKYPTAPSLILSSNSPNIKVKEVIFRGLPGLSVSGRAIKGKSPDQIRQTWNIKNDFTPEEEEQVRRENEWAEQ